MNGSISVIIPVFNGENTIEDCLRSVIDALPENKEIFVIDNDSNDSTRDIVNSFSDVHLLEEKKKGPAAARNRGLKFINSEIVIFVDSDVIVKKETFIELLKHLEEEKVAGVSALPESYDKHNLVSLSQDIRLFGNTTFDQKIRQVPTIATMVAAYKVKILKEVGYFDESYYPSGEDVDLNYRIRKKGYSLLIIPSARAYHNHPVSMIGLIKKWFDYGIGYVKVSKDHNTFSELLLSMIWLISMPILLIFSYLHFAFILVFLLVFIFPWILYYSMPTLRYLFKNKDIRVLLFPPINQMQIIARACGMFYGVLSFVRF